MLISTIFVFRLLKLLKLNLWQISKLYSFILIIKILYPNVEILLTVYYDIISSLLHLKQYLFDMILPFVDFWFSK